MLIDEYWKTRKSGKWFFHIRSNNGNIVASGGAQYNRKRNCLKTLRAFAPALKKIDELPPK